MPDVDLFLRTSGEQRTSNFLLWQSAYAELVFLDVLWPDVDRRHLWQACEVYASRDRRYGGALPSLPRRPADPARPGTSARSPRSPSGLSYAASTVGTSTTWGDLVERLARAVLRHRRLVGLFWVVMLLAGARARARSPSGSPSTSACPGSPATRPRSGCSRTYGVSTFDTVVPVLTAPDGRTIAQEQQAVAQVLDTVRTALPQLRVVDGLEHRRPGLRHRRRPQHLRARRGPDARGLRARRRGRPHPGA